MADEKIIFSMVRVGKVVPPNRQILTDISLSFFYGAKIGVLGLNGAGKSTLLKIIAGLDADILGEIVSDRGISFGYLPQEPALDPEKTVKAVIEEGVQDTVNLVAEYNAVNERFAEADADFDTLLARQAELQERIDHLNAWDLDSKLEMAADALRCPPGDTPVAVLSEEQERRNEEMELFIPPGPRLGDLVIETEGLAKAYGDTLLFEDVSFSLPAGGIVGVIGPNGAGKTTLFRLLTGRETSDSGTVRIGSTVQLAYVDQDRPLNPASSIWEEISGGEDVIRAGAREMNSRAYVARFNFSGSEQQKSVGVLSGGERNRVHLAKLLREGANVLLLDEPTNDLDVNTLRALEEALLSFAGCAVVISHDRWFLDRVATHILSFEGDSRVAFFDGNYSQYEAQRRKQLGAEADRPHRIRYKPLRR